MCSILHLKLEILVLLKVWKIPVGQEIAVSLRPDPPEHPGRLAPPSARAAKPYGWLGSSSDNFITSMDIMAMRQMEHAACR